MYFAWHSLMNFDSIMPIDGKVHTIIIIIILLRASLTLWPVLWLAIAGVFI